MADGFVHRVRALAEVSFSNSMIEAFWRSLRHQWLYLHWFESSTELEQQIDFYVKEHATQIPDHVDRLTTARHQARRARMEVNQRELCARLRTSHSTVRECYERRRKCAAVTPECSRTQQP